MKTSLMQEIKIGRYQYFIMIPLATRIMKAFTAISRGPILTCVKALLHSYFALFPFGTFRIPSLSVLESSLKHADFCEELL